MGGSGGTSGAKQRGEGSLQRLLVIARRPRWIPGDKRPYVLDFSDGFSPRETQWRAQFWEELEGSDRSFDGGAGFTFIATVPNRAVLRRMIRKHPRSRSVQIEILPLPPLPLEAAERLRSLKERYAEAERILRTDAGCRGRSRAEEIALHEHHWLGMLAEAEPLLPHHPFSADLLQALVEWYSMFMDLDRLEPLVRRLLAARQALVGQDDPALVHDWAALGRVLAQRARLGDASAAARAEAYCRRALEIAQRAWPMGHPERLDCLKYLAQHLQRTGRYEAAAQVWRRGAEEAERSEAPDTPVSAIPTLPVRTQWLQYLAAAERALGEHDEEERLLRRAAEAAERRLGADHELLIPVLELLAEACLSTGKAGEAAAAYERMIAIVRDGVHLVSGEDYPGWEGVIQAGRDAREAALSEKLALVLRTLGRVTEAAALQERALVLRGSAPQYQPTRHYDATDIQVLSPDVFLQAWDAARRRLAQENASAMLLQNRQACGDCI